MEYSSKANLPLIVIAAPTASGKTNLAIRLAKQYGGEIICADSRTIYKGMDIGTAKPSVEERADVPHWGLDLVEPGEVFTVADFQAYTNAKIDEIRARGHVPFLVGGTGLYIDAVIFDFVFDVSPDHKLRSQLEAYSIEELHKYCHKHNIQLPENSQNKRYVIRTIERNGQRKQRRDLPRPDSVIVGIATDRDILRTRIVDRAEQLFTNGVVEEAITLGKKYGWDSEAMTGNIYPLVRLHLEEGLSLKEMQDKFTTLDWRLAKRQLTWLRRNPYIQWYGLTEAESYLRTVLETEHKV